MEDFIMSNVTVSSLISTVYDFAISYLVFQKSWRLPEKLWYFNVVSNETILSVEFSSLSPEEVRHPRLIPVIIYTMSEVQYVWNSEYLRSISFHRQSSGSFAFVIQRNFTFQICKSVGSLWESFHFVHILWKNNTPLWVSINILWQL